jgi:hypothetical protein
MHPAKQSARAPASLLVVSAGAAISSWGIVMWLKIENDE